ncbi:3-oxoacyl-[acyl-carrier protein] reductase [Streptosporangium becharense]|uniref:3-oxoacyl-[acyl-carrier protein] reductase n=1 Tax=Streptosporangium becharense TaxID=1816182 RepID=A0A7W9MK26_9ACTN|nr:SDR family NAD(P)-dependent oxidoreductase [Streptosporangium becharense]MBB2910440.1 3-oxoacyl-[acyl-carrier protein] reductase [Streptosporangium becharense]MBB5823183.1 3-oxoacyl-[acyl-carrier protein] reductase [Streptosporangium becharense]
MRLDGRVAIVTGGTRGIGLRIAGSFLAEGARVMCAAREAAPVAELADVYGEAVAFHPADVRDAGSVRAMVEATAERFGGVDVLVANAGISRPAPTAVMPAQQWAEVVDTNLTGVFNCVQAALPYLEKSGSGRIVAVSSALSTRPVYAGASYCATKAAVDMLVRVWALEFAEKGITVNALSPGFIEEGMGRALRENTALWEQFGTKISMGRMGTGAEVAAAAVFLAGDEGSYVNGHIMEVNGGLRW